MKNKLTVNKGGNVLFSVFADDKNAVIFTNQMHQLHGKTVKIDVEKVTASRQSPKNPPKVKDDHPKG